MVFSSIPAYLDPSNWQQHQNHQIIGSSATNPLLTPQQQQQQQPGPPPPPPPQHHGAGAGSVRPNSMSERARIANIPMPETALKCPRCDSTNTKFCYFNNYSLSQPRHFCKACRRYWTRGGALRNVPVGGGCRRNKRSKSTSSSKSPASNDRQNTPNSTSNLSISTNSANMLGLTQPQLPPLRFMSQLSQLTDNFASDMGVGLSYSGITAPVVGTSEMNFHGTGNNLFGSSGGGGVASLLSSGVSGGIEPWRLQQQVQQFPFFGGLDSSPGGGIYHFQGGEPGFLGGGVGGESTSQQVMRPRISSSMLSQTASVKMEENNAEQQMNLPRQLMLGGTMNQGSNNEQWNNTNAANWTDLSSFSSSSTSNPL